MLPDSGERTQFETGAVRDASVGKGLPSCIPPAAIRSMARRFEEGATKYALHNWMKGIPANRFIDSSFRHLLSLMEGDDSEDHAGAVLWNIACLIWTLDAIKAGQLPPELDDRQFLTKKNP